MPLEMLRQDITRMEVDAIVNAANPALQMGGGVCGAIFRAAGQARLQAACDQIGGCETGEAVITPGFNLPARYVIHAPGPVWQGGHRGEARLLANCYKNALALAAGHKLQSIAFPLISSGIYGYPKDQALRIATKSIQAFLQDHDMLVYLLVFDDQAYLLGAQRFGAIKAFVDARYVGPVMEAQQLRQDPFAAPAPRLAPSACMAPTSRQLADAVAQLGESFSDALLRLIDCKGMTDVQVYKRANLDRKLFSKIRKGKGYVPSRSTALALAVALRLNLDETRDLLRRAGYALSPSSKADLIVEFYIAQGEYDVFMINEALFAFGQPPLGGLR